MLALIAAKVEFQRGWCKVERARLIAARLALPAEYRAAQALAIADEVSV